MGTRSHKFHDCTKHYAPIPKKKPQTPTRKKENKDSQQNT